MLKEEEKQLLEGTVVENPERAKLQQGLQKLIDNMLDDIIEKEDRASEGSG